MAASSPRTYSFEFFPPADAAMEATLWQSVQRRTSLVARCGGL
jgi:5,10-methylenetetrahydrofolate reductase